jgi:hypothetical protein
MGGACNTHKSEMRIKLWWENLNGRGHLESLDECRRIILKGILRNMMRGCGLNSFGS